ncbi:MAG: oligosaccharide flippase family protein, partial [bacterium]
VGRAIGVKEFGLYGTVVGYAAFGVVAISPGMERAIHVYVAPMEGEEEKKAVYLVRRLLALRLVTGLAVAALMFWLAHPVMTALGQPRVGYYLRWMGPYVVSVGLTNLFFAYYSARLDVKNARLAKAAIQLLNALGAVWIYRYGGGAGIVLLLLSMTVALTAIALAWMSRDVMRRPAERMDLGPVRSFCGSQTVMEFMTFVLGKNSDIILLNLLLAGTLQVGYYNVSAALTLAISTMLISGARDLALPATSIMVQRGDPKQLLLAWRFRIKTSVLLSVPFMVFAFAIAPTLVATVLDRTYLPAADVFRIAVTGQILLSLAGGGAHGDILLSSERHRTIRNLRIGSGVANIALNLILIPQWGAAGAAAATAVVAVGLVFAELLSLRRVYAAVLPGRDVLSMLAASAAAAAAVSWFPLTRWAYLFSSTAGFILVFVPLIWLLKPYDAEEREILERMGAPFDRLANLLVPSR